ncbi:MAG: hypothetical protein A2W31_14490 [Planctomycetes bacterium RBG_16_64_10]|nr:MAG: hypothetical protein A2W31_14490 [Planctomycetes bacterium RBG_16_64_10]
MADQSARAGETVTGTDQVEIDFPNRCAEAHGRMMMRIVPPDVDPFALLIKTSPIGPIGPIGGLTSRPAEGE